MSFFFFFLHIYIFIPKLKDQSYFYYTKEASLRSQKDGEKIISIPATVKEKEREASYTLRSFLNG